jgi:N6-L-threonylcarbamoyladenine synthase
MLVLGIESSCDDTAASVVEDGSAVLSSVVSSQDSIHARFGGIVPELASRRHIEMVLPVVEKALDDAKATIDDIGAIAVTQGPGLVGSILVGLSFAKSICLVKGMRFTGVNHIEAHAHAAFIREGTPPADAPRFPFVSLIASGGHTTLLLFKGFTEYSVLGSTLDDAAGEAFDKVSKLLGLGFPGGAVIDSLARSGRRDAFGLKRPYMARHNLDFSFSGIKTAVSGIIKGGSLSADAVNDLAASFQEAMVDVLAAKSMWAIEKTGASDLVVAGGVACNSRLRQRLTEEARKRDIRLFIPEPRFCTDNGAVVASLGFRQIEKGMFGGLDMNARPTWEGF